MRSVGGGGTGDQTQQVNINIFLARVIIVKYYITNNELTKSYRCLDKNPGHGVMLLFTSLFYCIVYYKSEQHSYCLVYENCVCWLIFCLF